MSRGEGVCSVWEDRTGSVLSDGNLPERPQRLMEMLLNEGRKGFKWAITRRRCWASFLKYPNGCGYVQPGACVLFQHICCCASMCQSVCGSRGNRWEVCHVLVNKSVIVLFCPAWLTVSCAGSTPFPLNPRSTNTHARTHIPHTHMHTNRFKDTPNHAHKNRFCYASVGGL